MPKPTGAACLLALPVTEGLENGYSTALVNAVHLTALGINYLAFAVMFLLDRRAVAIAGVQEDMPVWRNVLHWLLTWPTLLMYNCVQVVASLEGSLRGEAVVTHDASKKDHLGQQQAKVEVVINPATAPATAESSRNCRVRDYQVMCPP